MVLESASVKVCLVVDDSRVIRKVARRILEDLGFEVAEAADGAEALGWLRTVTPQVILLDWNMPGMSGLEILKALRAAPGGEEPRVIFCSVEEFVAAVRDRDEERLIWALVEAMSPSETSFFRHPETFERIAEKVLPQLARGREGRPLRVWAAACGTEQEVYSLAMLLAEQ